MCVRARFEEVARLLVWNLFHAKGLSTTEDNLRFPFPQELGLVDEVISCHSTTMLLLPSFGRLFIRQFGRLLSWCY